MLLDALKKRKSAAKVTQQQKNDVTLDLGSTWFQWDTSDGYCVGPPCGNLWAGFGDSRKKLAPSAYESLRKALEDTQSIEYTQELRRKEEEEAKQQFLNLP